MTFTRPLHNAQQGHQAIQAAWEYAKPLLLAGHRLMISIKPATRSLEQNAMLWSILTDLSNQVDWPVDGKAQKLAPEEWKDILSAGLTKHQRVAQGLEGGWVMLGERTSKMTVGQMSDLITLAHAFGDERGVRWSRTSLGRDVPDEVAA